MKDYAIHELLVQYPLVSEDAPEWKKVCPFCGAFDEVHESEDIYICHECHANWIEHDTETERQIQILNLNNGKMPRFNKGDMPIVERKLYDNLNIIAHVDLDTDKVNFFNGGYENDKFAANF
ncbi:MAG: hypothetical protein IKN30_04350 [Synergistaceae bacterium]|nr:hypothetical protein [Synergistaceae bacterium]